MNKTIDITEELYRRLEAHASAGFDTPSSVISRILDFYESAFDTSADREDLTTHENFTADSSNTDTSEQNANIQHAVSLDIVYVSGSYVSRSEEKFKQDLLVNKRAYIKLCYTNGKMEVKVWNALNFRPTSIVDSNLRSGYLRNWKERGITKAILSVNSGDLAADKTIASSLVNIFEQDTGIQHAKSLDIVYVSGSYVSRSEEKFKQDLLVNKRAYIKLFYTNGEVEDRVWNALNFRPTSIVDGNLRSGYLRKWRQRGIHKAVLSVNRRDLETLSDG